MFRFRRTLWGLLAACATSISCSSDAKVPSDPGGSPGPAFSAPISIAVGQTIGAATYPAGNGATGGQGQAVQGASCDASLPVQHIHAHLTIIANGVQRAIPLGVGAIGMEVISNFAVNARCFYWIHTHDATGIVHVEAPVSTPFTMGELFAIWGEPLTRTDVAGFQGTVVAYVDSARFDGDLSALAFTERQQITLIVGTVPDTIPVYAFPSAF